MFFNNNAIRNLLLIIFHNTVNEAYRVMQDFGFEIFICNSCTNFFFAGDSVALAINIYKKYRGFFNAEPIHHSTTGGEKTGERFPSGHLDLSEEEIPSD